MISGRILITGATGFLGSEIVRQALGAGLKIRATDKTYSTKLSGIDLVPADILEPLSLSGLFEGVNCVCHVAGLTPFSDRMAINPSFHDVNVEGAENVARVVIEKKVSLFIFISSVSVYGQESRGQHENSEYYPEGPYAESKLQAERRLIEIFREKGMNLTILRLATLYGEGENGNLLRLIRLIDRGRFVWVGQGDNIKSLLHRDDAARACLEVIKSPVEGINVYNVSASPCKMRDIVEAITTDLGKSVLSWHIPAALVLNLVNILKLLSLNHVRIVAIYNNLRKWLADDYYDTNKFKKTFNFQAEISCKEGIKKEVSWYKRAFPREER